MANEIKQPKACDPDFTCPHCRIHSRQEWFNLENKVFNNQVLTVADSNHIITILKNIPRGRELMLIAFCDSCKEFSIWISSQMVYPEPIPVEPPNQDLDNDIKQDYLEAASILQKSPRGAAALLRLAIQKLCKQLGEPGEKVDLDIASLVKKGLSVKIQQCLDSIRVIGNEAVHPGELDLRDDIKTATQLFRLINFIAEAMITERKHIEEIYSKIPNTKKEAIEKRDAASRN